MSGDMIVDLITNVMKNGAPVNSRYGETVELIGAQLAVESNILVAREGINYSLGWMEMLQLAAGVFDPDALKRVAPKADHSLFTLSMAYGPRIALRIQSIIEALRVDPLTRQAVLFIGIPENGPTSDLPCTLTYQFLHRNGELNGIITMRSWDLCRGLPYDLMMFGGLLKLVARCLNLPAGFMVIQAASAHVYVEWSHRLPYTSDLTWDFYPDIPTTWNDIQEWAIREIANMRKSDLPRGVFVKGR